MPFRFLTLLFVGTCLLAAQRHIPALLPPSQDLVPPAIRDARSRTFNSNRPLSRLEPTAGRMGRPRVQGEFLPAPELPFEEADTVLVGEVIRIQPFLSSDKKGIYTEYVIRVADSIKSAPGTSPSAGDSLTILREGGAVRLPNGQVAEHRLINDVTPAINQSYLFCLVHVPSVAGFHYTKLWLIQNGQVQPLYPDDIGRTREGRSVYAGKPLSEVTALLKALIGK